MRRRRGKQGGPDYPYTWGRVQKPPKRKGQACRITSRKYPAPVVRVEFKDGREFLVDKGGLVRR